MYCCNNIVRESDVGDAKWLRNMLTSGTLTDKIGAMSSLVQNDPVHNIDIIDDLFTMANKKGKREAQLAIQSLRELFILFLLPDRPLRFISQQPLENEEVNDHILVLFYFEHLLKQKYVQVSHHCLSHVSVHRAAEEIQLRHAAILQEDRRHLHLHLLSLKTRTGIRSSLYAGRKTRRSRRYGAFLITESHAGEFTRSVFAAQTDT